MTLDLRSNCLDQWSIKFQIISFALKHFIKTVLQKKMYKITKP